MLNSITKAMQIKPLILLVALTISFVTIGHAQPQNFVIKNGFGIGGGVTQLDIISDNFETMPGSGWMVLASATGDLPHKWYNMSYVMQMSENTVGISGRMTDDVAGNEMIDYSLFTAQVGLIMHIKLIGANMTLDLGPQLQYNGKLEVKNAIHNDYFINGYGTLGAEDIKNISQINGNGMAGVSAGYGPLKVRAQYMYGITNIFKKLNDQNLNIGDAPKFEGNQSLWAFTAIFTF